MMNTDFDAILSDFNWHSLLEDPLYRQWTGESGFTQTGYWENGVADHSDACRTLVKRLLALLPEERGPIAFLNDHANAIASHLPHHLQVEDATATSPSEADATAARTPAATGNGPLAPVADGTGHAPASLNIACCVECLRHPESRTAAFKQAYRALAPGGHILIADLIGTAGGELEIAGVSGPEHYPRYLEEIGFQDPRVVDMTKPCWEGWYWALVNHIHVEHFAQRITYEELKGTMARVYKRLQLVSHYVFASGRKG